MNANLPDADASILYYDSDYPSADHGLYSENLDPTTEQQGVAGDVDRYLELASKLDGSILEVGCGSGRVAIPLARAGHKTHGVDVSSGMLESLRAKLPSAVADRLTFERADATTMELEERDFAFCGGDEFPEIMQCLEEQNIRLAI
ncbi:MAG: class I SAM-dependent methyltransferase [bacterium]|nr:class I SAM-dependent methyltransferase [bacterium]